MVWVKDFLRPESILFSDCTDKTVCLNQLVDCLARSPLVEDVDALRKAVFSREDIISTGIGLGIAIPHVKIPQVRDLTVAVAICRNGIDWGAIDDKPVHIVFMIAGNEDQHALYLQTLSKIVLVLKNKRRRAEMLAADSPQRVLELFETV